MVLTRLGHAAEQPPPRKDRVKSRQRMMMVVMTVVGGLGLHVEVYGRVQGPVQTKRPRCVTLSWPESLGQTTWPTFPAPVYPGLSLTPHRKHPSHQSVALANHLNVMNKLLLI